MKPEDKKLSAKICRDKGCFFFKKNETVPITLDEFTDFAEAYHKAKLAGILPSEEEIENAMNGDNNKIYGVNWLLNKLKQ